MFSVTRNDKPVSEDLYNWDESTKTFSSNEDGLVLDFNGHSGMTFKTGSNCSFKTGSSCKFNTGACCIFNTGYNCTFDTGSYCTFNTSYGCVFNTGSYCTFNVGYRAVIVRRDVFEVITLEEGGHIKSGADTGCTHIKDTKTITIDGEDIGILPIYLRH